MLSLVPSPMRLLRVSGLVRHLGILVAVGRQPEVELRADLGIGAELEEQLRRFWIADIGPAVGVPLGETERRLVVPRRHRVDVCALVNQEPDDIVRRMACDTVQRRLTAPLYFAKP